MNKEKEIDEMNKVIEDMEATALISATIVDGYCVYDYRDIAESYYKAGYRKADEVRKETAREIFELIDKHIKWFNDGFTSAYTIPILDKEAIEQIKKDVKSLYGIEVDE